MQLSACGNSVWAHSGNWTKLHACPNKLCTGQLGNHSFWGLWWVIKFTMTISKVSVWLFLHASTWFCGRALTLRTLPIHRPAASAHSSSSSAGFYCLVFFVGLILAFLYVFGRCDRWCWLWAIIKKQCRMEWLVYWLQWRPCLAYYLPLCSIVLSSYQQVHGNLCHLKPWS